MAASAQQDVLRVLFVDAPGGVVLALGRVVAPHIVDVVALHEEDVADAAGFGHLRHLVPGVHVAHRLVGHDVDAALRFGIEDALAVGHRRRQRLLHEGMTALLQRHDGLIGVQVVRPGHDDHVGPGRVQELGEIGAGCGLRVQRLHAIELRLLGIDDACDLAAPVGRGHLGHAAAGAAAAADKKPVLAHVVVVLIAQSFEGRTASGSRKATSLSSSSNRVIPICLMALSATFASGE